MISQKLIDEYRTSPSAFRRDLQIEVSGEVRRLGAVIEPWQAKDFAAIDPGMKLAAGLLEPSDSIVKRAWYERARGHAKTSDLAVVCCWMLAFANRPLSAFCFAADKDQSSLLKDAIHRLIRMNPWLSDIIDVQKDVIVNKFDGCPGKGSKLTISASDVGSSYGITPDCIIVDEITHWQGDGALWHSLISSAAKKKNCLLVVISNAGFVDSWQWGVREAVRTSPDTWHFSCLDGPQASWMTEAVLAEQRKMLPEIAYKRLFMNIWSSGGGDALLEADINAAFDPNMKPMIGIGGEIQDATDEFVFVAGVDLGLSRDHSAVIVLALGKMGTSQAGRIRLAAAKTWAPPKGGQIDLMAIETYLLEVDEKLGLDRICYDPWQAELLAQRIAIIANHRRGVGTKFHGDGEWIFKVTPSASNLREIASLVLESFADRRFQLYLRAFEIRLAASNRGREVLWISVVFPQKPTRPRRYVFCV